MVTLKAPAKLNLTLEVLGKRPDGFHEIRSIVQAINLCDSLSFGLNPGIEIQCDAPGWTAKKSLVSKAITLLQETSGCRQGVIIRLHKRIPLLSGLGGDSSDAAATLRGLNRLWGLNLPRWQLAELASQLGSDVTFFLFGGTTLIEGRGDVVTLLPSLPRMWAVLLIPPVSRVAGKTERLYVNLKASHYTEGQVTDELMTTITSGHQVASAKFFNVFEAVADDAFNGLEQYRWRFLAAGAYQVRLAGSGPALFSLVREKRRAEKIYKNLKQERLEAYLAETLSSLD